MPYINIKIIIIKSTIKVNSLCNKQVSCSASPKQKSDCKLYQQSSLRASYSRDRIYQCSKYLFPAIRHKSRYTAEWRPLLPALYGILRHRSQPANLFYKQYDYICQQVYLFIQNEYPLSGKLSCYEFTQKTLVISCNFCANLIPDKPVKGLPPTRR